MIEWVLMNSSKSLMIKLNEFRSIIFQSGGGLGVGWSSDERKIHLFWEVDFMLDYFTKIKNYSFELITTGFFFQYKNYNSHYLQ